MLNNLAQNQQTYLVTGYTDLRQSIDGLAAIVQAQLELDPYSTALFLFCGRRSNCIKGLQIKQPKAIREGRRTILY